MTYLHTFYESLLTSLEIIYHRHRFKTFVDTPIVTLRTGENQNTIICDIDDHYAKQVVDSKNTHGVHLTQIFISTRFIYETNQTSMFNK
jgi:hypothetical protein